MSFDTIWLASEGGLEMTSVCPTSHLAQIGTYTESVTLDWSDDQLKKHFREIQAFLGNTLLRITSKRIDGNMKGATILTLDDILQDKASPHASVIEASQALAEKVAGFLGQMEVADAMAQIVDLLRQVSYANYARLLNLNYSHR